MQKYRIQHKCLCIIVMAAFSIVLAGAKYSMADQDDKSNTAILKILGVHFPPYEIENPSDGRRGYDIDVVEAALEKVGLEAEFTFVPWSRAKNTVEGGRATALITCSYRPAREEFYLFSDAISDTTRGFYVLADYDGPEIKVLEDIDSVLFANYSIGVVHGYSYEKTLKKMGIAYDPAPNDVSAIKKLLARRIDLFLSIKENTEYHLREMGVETDLKFFHLREEKYYLCFGKKWPNVKVLMEKFNKGLAQIRASGEYEEIHARYR